MRLIDADKLKAHYAWWGNDGAEYRERKADFDVIVDLQPTVDQTKHGRWLPSDKGDCTYICSECGFVRDAYILEEKAYCPRCGARMDAQIGEDKSHPFAESVIMGMDEVEE